MTTAPPAAAPATAAGQRAGPPGPGARARLRGWGWPVVIVLVILLGAIVIALLRRPAGPGLPLDPHSAGPGGSEAVADLLAQRGVQVIRTGTVPGTVTAARAAPATMVVTSPGALSVRQLAQLAGVPADLVLVAPSPAALQALAPAVSVAGFAPVTAAAAACGLPAARLAGRADLGGTLLRSIRPGAAHCYPVAGPVLGWGLVRYVSGGRAVTVLGTGTPLTNHDLAREGNAALALNLLSGHRRVAWLVPGRASPAAAPAAPSRPRSLFSLLPPAAYLVTAQLAVAAVLAALWRMRRFGPLVTEPLAVAVRASETTEGHARLYQARRSRDRAAAALRAATLGRLLPRLGLPADAVPAAVCGELAHRSGRPAGEIEALLYGPVPGDDGALVALAAGLDTLEGEVLIP